jgi:hypothetical protein
VLKGAGRFVFSIVHPCYGAHVEILSDYLLDHRYLKAAPVDWLPPHAYHPPLGDYVNQLARTGLLIERVVEMHLRPAAGCRWRPRASLRSRRPLRRSSAQRLGAGRITM